MTPITREQAMELAEKFGAQSSSASRIFQMHETALAAMLTDFRQQVIADFASLQSKLEQSDARVMELEKTMKWLDAWLGSRPMPECSAKIRAALNKEPEA